MRKNKLWSWTFVHILLLYCLVQMVLYMTTPVLAKYVLSLGQSNSVAGVISGAFSITALVFRPFSGYLSDGFRKKKLLLIALAATSVALFGYCIANKPWQLFLFRLIQGGAYAISTTVMMSMVSEIIDESVRGAGIGYYALAASLAAAVGPGIGLKLVDLAGYKNAILLAAGIAFVAMLFGLLQPYREKAVPAKHPEGFRFDQLIAKEVLALAGFSCLFSFANGLLSNFLAILGEARGIAGISLYFTVNAVVMAVTKPLSGRITDQYGLHYVMYVAFACSAVGLYLLAGASSLPAVLLVAVLYGIGIGAGQPAIQAQTTKEVELSQIGVAVSTCYLGNDIGQGLGPVLGGVISDGFGYGMIFLVAGILHTAAIALFWLYEKKHGRAAARA